MKLPSSSSAIMLAALAVSTSTPSLAAPTGETRPEPGLSTSSSARNFHARRVSHDIRSLIASERRSQLVARDGDVHAEGVSNLICDLPEPLGNLVKTVVGIIPELPILGDLLRGPLDAVIHCDPKAAGAEAVDPRIAEAIAGLRVAADQVSKEKEAAGGGNQTPFQQSPPQDSSSNAPLPQSSTSGSAAPPNTPAMAHDPPVARADSLNTEGLPVQPPAAPLQPPITVPAPPSAPVQPPVPRPGVPVDATKPQAPVNPGGLPVHPPVNPGDLPGQKLTLPVDPATANPDLQVQPPTVKPAVPVAAPVQAPVATPFSTVSRRGIAAQVNGSPPSRRWRARSVEASHYDGRQDASEEDCSDDLE